MAYYITATSERGKPVTKYGSDYIAIQVERNRKPVAVITIDCDGIEYEDKHDTIMLNDWTDGQTNGEYPEPTGICASCGRDTFGPHCNKCFGIKKTGTEAGSRIYDKGQFTDIQ